MSPELLYALNLRMICLQLSNQTKCFWNSKEPSTSFIVAGDLSYLMRASLPVDLYFKTSSEVATLELLR